MYIEYPERIQGARRGREKQQRVPELKSQKRVKNFIYVQNPESRQHIEKRKYGRQICQPNIKKTKVSGLNNMKKHQPKKKYNLRSKYNISTATVSEINHSRERVQQMMNEERLLFDQNKNASVFVKLNEPSQIANGGYDHADSQYGRYGYDYQADNQYRRDGYGQVDSEYSRYRQDHQADYQYSGNGCDIRLMISMVDVGVMKQMIKLVGLNKCIGSNQRHNFDSNGSCINSKYFQGNHHSNTDTQQPKPNQFIGRGGMNVYNVGVIH